MRRSLALTAILVLAACAAPQPKAQNSVPPTATPTASGPQPTAAPSPTPTPRTLMVVLEAIGANTRLGEPGVADSYDTVAIAGTDGVAVAKTTFTARTLPVVGNAAPVLGLPAVVADGAVFFSDRQGVIRRLDVSGTVTTEATFPVDSSQQLLRFAVSPDGQHLMGSVFTFPPVNANATNPGEVFAPGAHYHVTLYSAGAGGPATKVYDKDSADFSQPKAMVAGWDATGPLATVDSFLGTQQGPGGRRVNGGPLARLNSDGSLGNTVGGADCSAVDYHLDGSVICGWSSQRPPWVAGPAGDTRWALDGCQTQQSPAFPYGMALSPDTNQVLLSKGVCRKDGSLVPYPGSGYPLGWLDDQTVVLWTEVNAHEMALWKPGAATATDLGYKAAFVGVIRG